MPLFPPGWDANRTPRRRRPQAAKPIDNAARLHVENLEKRQLFDVNVWLPQRIAPIDGIAGYWQDKQLFLPATTSMRPDLGLTSGSMTLTGSYTLDDLSLYSLDLQASGPDGSGSFTFSESLDLMFVLTEEGTFNAAGYNPESVLYSPNGYGPWSFLETDGSGAIVTSMGGDAMIGAADGTVVDPLFIPGFNWLDVTQALCSNYGLDIDILSATSLTLQENSGSDSFAFTESNGSATLGGTGSQALMDAVDETGQESYSDGVVESFTYTNSGDDTFTLSEAGGYADGSFGLSSVAYNEQSSGSSSGGMSGGSSLGSLGGSSGAYGDSFQFTDTLIRTRSGAESGGQSYTGTNPSLDDSSSDSFQFGELDTYTYGESGGDSYSLYEGGSFSGGQFDLSSLSYNAQGAGGYSLTESSNQTQTDGFSDSENMAGHGSFGIGGTLTNGDTVTQTGTDTSTAVDTIQDGGSALYTTSIQGAYGGGSFALATFNLSESATGNVTVQQADSQTSHGSETDTASGTGNDSYALGLGAGDTTTGSDNSTYSDSAAGSFSASDTDNVTSTAASSYTLSEIAAALNGSYSLSSYVFSSGVAGSFNETTTADETTSDAGSDSDDGSSAGGDSDVQGGASDSDSGGDSFQSGDSYTAQGIETSAANDSGSFGQATYQAGTYGNGSFAFGSVAYSSGANDTSLLSATDSNTDAGTDSSSDSGDGQSDDTTASGPTSENGLDDDTFSDSGHDTFSDFGGDTVTDSGHDSFNLSEVGTYANRRYVFSGVVYAATGNANGTTLDDSGGSSSGNGSDASTGSGSGADTSTSGVGSDDGLDSFTGADSSTFSQQGHDTVAETATTADSWTLSESGNFSNGSWSLSSVLYGESFSDTTALFQNDYSTESGSDVSAGSDQDSDADTTTYGGGSFNGSGSVSDSDSDSDTFTEASSDTVTGTEQDSFSLFEAGVLSGLSFNWSSLVYQGGATVNTTDLNLSAETFSGSALETGSDQGQGDGSGSYASAGDSDAGSFSDSGNEHDAVGDDDSSGATIAQTDRSSFYESGAYALGSYAFTSVAFGDAVSDNATFQGLDSSSDTGTFAQDDAAGDSLSFDVQPGGGLDSGGDSVTAGDTLSGSDSATSDDSFSGHDVSSFSLTQLGSYANGSFAFSSWVSQSGDSFSETAVDTFGSGFGESGTESGAGSSADSLTQAAGYDSSTQSNSDSDSGSDSFIESGGDGGSTTDVSAGNSSDYEAGAYSLGSLALSSVAFSSGGSDAWSERDSGTSTQAEAETLTVSGAFQGADTSAYGGDSVSGGDSLSGGDSFNGTDTTAATDTSSDVGSDSWSLSEQGTYSGDSFAFSNVAYQDGESDSGTVQEADVDTFASSAGDSSSEGDQEGDGDSLGQDSGSDQSGDSTAQSGVSGESGHGGDSVTDTGSRSFSLGELGSFAGGSFAFSNVNYHAGSNDSETAADSSTASDSWGLAGTDSGSDAGTDSGNYGSTTDGGQESATDSLGEDVTADGTQTDSVTQTDQSSFSLSEQGSEANGSFAFSSYLLTEGDIGTVTAQETDTEGLSDTEDGVLTDEQRQDDDVAAVAGSGLLTVSDGGSDSDSDVLRLLLSGTDTTTRTAGSFLRSALSEAGSYVGGSLSLSSVLFSETAGQSDTVQDNATFSSTDTQQVGETEAESDAGADAGDGAGDSGNESFAELDTVTSTDGQTDNGSFTQTVYEAGNFANGSYSLSCFSLLEQSAETDSVSDVSQDAAAESGSGSGMDTVDGYAVYNGSDNFTDSGSSTDADTGTATSGFVLSELGAFSNGSFSLSDYLLSVQQASSQSVSDAGSSADSVTGTNQGDSYSGPGSDSFGDTDVSSSSGSLTEQGSYANGSFALGTVTYQGSGSDSFSDGEADSDNWSGGYSGTDSSSDQDGGSSSFTNYESGNFSNGSFSLGSYVLWGGSSGSYSDSGGDQETLSGAASSFARAVTGQGSDTLYQSGSMTAGAFSNASYTYVESSSDTTTDAASGPGYASSDTWVDGDGMQESGSGTSATETQTDGTTFSYCEGTDPTDSNDKEVTITVAPLGPAMGLPLPDVTTVPVGGADQGGGGAEPVTAAPNLGEVDITQTALGDAEAGASQAVGTSANEAVAKGESVGDEVVLCQAPPAKDAKKKELNEYQKEALKRIGVKPEEYEKLLDDPEFVPSVNRDGPDKPLSKKFIERPLAIMVAIAKAYAGLYKERGDLYLWAGFAAIAVNDGILPNTARALGVTGDTGEIRDKLLADYLNGNGFKDLQNLSRDGARATFKGNIAIFLDLYWVHLAYLKGGITEIRRLQKAGEIDANIAKGFDLIDQGRQAIATKEGRKLIEEGNLLLFEHEQVDVLTPVFEEYAAAMRLATNLKQVGVPNKKLREIVKEGGGETTFPGKDFGPAKERWAWLESVTWTAFLSLEKSGRARDEIQRAFDGKPLGDR